MKRSGNAPAAGDEFRCGSGMQRHDRGGAQQAAEVDPLADALADCRDQPDSGGLVICKDKSKLDKHTAVRVIKKSLSNNYYYFGYEWPYKNVKPRIIAEPYIEDSVTKELRDYKFFCFNGKVKALFIATDRNVKGVDVKFDFFDETFHHLPFKQGHENAATMPQKPVCFEEMKQLASRLSEGFPHVRVDLYEVDGRVFFGEMTFFHHGGWTKFDPEEWDEIFGSWLSLPSKTS